MNYLKLNNSYWDASIIGVLCENFYKNFRDGVSPPGIFYFDAIGIKNGRSGLLSINFISLDEIIFINLKKDSLIYLFINYFLFKYLFHYFYCDVKLS